uniref:Uncharacterized protein n=1 Tax=Romanomermis culicivorax TaxID=13658 RepID=A0A915KUJ9_ROMCU
MEDFRLQSLRLKFIVVAHPFAAGLVDNLRNLGMHQEGVALGTVELGPLTGSDFTSALWLEPFRLLVVLDTTGSGKGLSVTPR